jgi:Myb/SANT-like DNA-binding domain
LSHNLFLARKLAELGYKRSAKKCREKFENVQKYYKRTKDGRAGQKDGKMYRFFAELETLNLATLTPNPSHVAVTSATAMPVVSPVSSGILITPISSGPPLGPIQPTPISIVAPTQNTEAGPMGFTTSSSESEESDSEMTDASGNQEKGGRKRKMMELFEGLVKQVMERQEEMQKLFLETLERREQERMAREDAWRRQETARLNREHEILSHERAMATSRDAALVSFIQRMNMQSVQPAAIPPTTNMTVTVMSPKPNNQQKQQVPRPANLTVPALKQQVPSEQPPGAPQLPPPQEQQEKQERVLEVIPHQAYNSSPVESREIVLSTVTETTPSSRWPKVEVHALIKIRTELEMRYQENGPKGPMWEEISAGMKRMGYNRSAKRCKEKWENINKYFKRVKESSKRRPEDSKTCPYFHELDALYRKKLLAGNGNAGGAVNMQVILAPPVISKSESESKNGNDGVGKTSGQPEETVAKDINGR